jgi:hypothetical protein
VATCTPGASSARFEIAQSVLSSAASRALDRWIDVWRADDPTAHPPHKEHAAKRLEDLGLTVEVRPVEVQVSIQEELFAAKLAVR